MKTAAVKMKFDSSDAGGGGVERGVKDDKVGDLDAAAGTTVSKLGSFLSDAPSSAS